MAKTRGLSGYEAWAIPGTQVATTKPEPANFRKSRRDRLKTAPLTTEFDLNNPANYRTPPRRSNA